MQINRSNLIILSLLIAFGIGSSLTVFSNDDKKSGNQVTGAKGEYACESADTDTGLKKVESKSDAEKKAAESESKSVGGGH